jgi:hypothetical protein
MKKVILILTAVLSVSTIADARVRDRDRYEREREREAFCKESIRAAGDAFHLLRAARASAIKRWQEQVINAHGERYMNFENARVADIHCDPARVGGGSTILDLKRCVVVARPCRAPRED